MPTLPRTDATRDAFPHPAGLDTALIRGRVAEMGLSEQAFLDLIGLRLSDLEEDLDQRPVSLTLLMRLSTVLWLTLDQLVTVEEEPPPVAQPTDANPMTPSGVGS